MRKSGRQKQKFSTVNKQISENDRTCKKRHKRITKSFRTRLRNSLSQIESLKSFIETVIEHAEDLYGKDELYGPDDDSLTKSQLKKLQLTYIRHELTNYDAILYEIQCPGQKKLMRSALHAIVKECHAELITRLCQECQGQ